MVTLIISLTWIIYRYRENKQFHRINIILLSPSQEIAGKDLERQPGEKNEIIEGKIYENKAYETEEKNLEPDTEFPKAIEESGAYMIEEESKLETVERLIIVYLFIYIYFYIYIYIVYRSGRSKESG